MKTHRHRGLTLLELVIAIAVLAVLGALAVPSLSHRLDQQRLGNAAEALVSDLNEARYEAARQGRAMHVVMQTGPAWCWAVVTEPGCACGQRQACELRSATLSDHAGVRLVQAATVHMLSTGHAQDAGSAVLESRRGATLRVDVQPLGRARICAVGSDTSRYPAC